MDDAVDVVIVGGGIAGGALATALARDGLDVLVLEASEEYEDRVRGEAMMPWGVAEARELGVEQALLDAGARFAPEWTPYHEGMDPAEAEANPIPVGTMVPEVSGSLNLRHPDACTVLTGLAVDAGADVRRGVRDVVVTGGESPVVQFDTGDGPAHVRCRLVVGADGRASVVRRAAGIELEKQDATDYIAGLLIDDVDGLPEERDFFGAAPDCWMLGFQQGNGRMRAYIVVGESGRRRFAGSGAAERFLEACAVDCIPFSREIATGAVAGPCATYPGTETWCSRPFTDGIVLVGDAAGHSNPIIGQGLSIAVRDARMVRDLLRAGEWRDFTAYGDERVERMRRIRLAADLIGVAYAEDAPDRIARFTRLNELQNTDERVFSIAAAIHGGPEVFPAEVFDPVVLDLVRAADAA